ncbi:MAG: anthranilate synthase component I family protein, partial [Congregibacter sp.]|nr:anthranilate synthase component I family protein [Congregibacter sp.]
MLSGSAGKQVSLPYFDDPCEVFQRLRHLGDTVLLDSGSSASRGQFDIVAAHPDASRSLFLDSACLGEPLRASLSVWQTLAKQQIDQNPAPGDLPFHGGYIGHFSYELGRRLQGFKPAPDSTLPIAVVRYYPWAVVQDRKRERSWLVGEADAVSGIAASLETLLNSQCENAHWPDFDLLEPFKERWSLADYDSRFKKVKDYITGGDCYQINIGQPFCAAFTGDLFTAYRQLRSIAKAPFSGFFPLDDKHALLSLSPERFLTVDQGVVETRPIKGTRPRYADFLQDQAAAAALLASDKERAENLMIVDLLRNDIGRFCKPGSIRVEELFALESYSTVHHLVSAVTGVLASSHSALDLLLGCLPGGSITGAPKKRAREIIHELE